MKEDIEDVTTRPESDYVTDRDDTSKEIEVMFSFADFTNRSS